MEIKKIAVVGAGALGVMYGSYLTNAYGNENVAFLADKERVLRSRSKQYMANGETCSFSFVEPQDFGTADLILFCVKYTAFSQAMELVKPCVGENTVFLSVLNGIASERDLSREFGETHLLYCVAQEMDAMKEGTSVQWTKMGVLVIGTKDGNLTEDLLAVESCLDMAGIAYRQSDNIIHAQWSKLMLNTGINQCCAVFSATYEDVLNTPEYRRVFEGAMREVQQIAAHEGITLTDEEFSEWIRIVGTLKPDGYPSMRQDTLAKRPTEVELFSGTICRLGKTYGVATPVNSFLYDQIRQIEDGWR